MLFEMAMFEYFCEILRNRCRMTLPGADAQNKMVPAVRIKQMEERIKSGITPKDSSILIPLYKHHQKVTTVLIHRTHSNGVHSRQIAFPGGKMDVRDKDHYETAVREAKEELGIYPDNVEYIGKLTDLYVPPSNFIIHPFIGFLREKQDFFRDEKEVESFFETPLVNFCDPGKKKVHPFKMVDDTIIETPCYDIDGHFVWGATAMIISEFAEILHEIKADYPELKF